MKRRRSIPMLSALLAAMLAGPWGLCARADGAPGLDAEVCGVLRDERGASALFVWNTETQSPCPGARLEVAVCAAARDAESGALWLMDTRGALFRVAERTGKTLRAAGGAYPVTGMAYDAVHDGFLSVNGAYILNPASFADGVQDPTAGYAIVSLLVGDAECGGTGAQALVGAAAAGTTDAPGEAGTSARAGQRIYSLDSLGYLWEIVCWETENGAYGFRAAHTRQPAVDAAALTLAAPGLSMVYDGERHLLCFTARDRRGGDMRLYALRYEEKSGDFTCRELGSFGTGVCAAALYGVRTAEGAGKQAVYDDFSLAFAQAELTFFER